MDWYFDFVVLFVTLFVITIAMTIYVRRYPTRIRFTKYVYTGLIPTITITGCEDIPNPLIVPPSEETSDNEQEDSSLSSNQDTVLVTESPRKASLTVPDLDDDYDDEEETVEIVEIESIPVVDNNIKEEKHDTVTVVCSQEKENKPLIEEKIETKLDNKDDLTDTQIVPVVTENEIQLDKDEQLIEEQVINEPSPKEACLVNGFTWKYGTSHTVEDPLFPFSEAVEDEKPLLRNRFKKRLSQ